MLFTVFAGSFTYTLSLSLEAYVQLIGLIIPNFTILAGQPHCEGFTSSPCSAFFGSLLLFLHACFVDVGAFIAPGASLDNTSAEVAETPHH